jgi:hypothetical protein
MGIFLLLVLALVKESAGKSEACEECNCFWRANKKHIDCSYAGLTEIPDGINTWTYSLSLQGNDIEDLGLTTTLGSATLSGLEILNLANNPILNLTTGFFDVAPNLKALMLHHTELQTLPDNIFDTLTGLEYLWLHNNALTTVPANAFKYLDNLWELYLQGNALSTIPDTLFSAQKNIRHIYLHDQENMDETLPTCCQMCGLPNYVDVKWASVAIDEKMTCGCGGDYCNNNICNNPAGSTLTCANYQFSAAGRSISVSLLVSSIASVVVAALLIYL